MKYEPTILVTKPGNTNNWIRNNDEPIKNDPTHHRAQKKSMSPGQNSPCLTDLPDFEVYTSSIKLTRFSFDKKNKVTTSVGIVNGSTKRKLMVRAIDSAIHTDVKTTKKKTIFQKLSLFILALTKPILGAFGLSYIPPYSLVIVGNLVKSCMRGLADQRFKLYSLILSKLNALAKQIMPVILFVFLALCGNSTSSFASNEQDIFYNKKYVASLITRAEKSYQIPRGLLAAIAKTESGMRAYALNIGGREINAESVFEAKEIIQNHIDSGGSNIDIGVMQINWRWHGGRFNNIWDILSPERNVNYAARLLKSLHKQHGNWDKAVRYYHSANPEHNNRYFRKVVTCWLGS
jgi:hypothetical protein